MNEGKGVKGREGRGRIERKSRAEDVRVGDIFLILLQKLGLVLRLTSA